MSLPEQFTLRMTALDGGERDVVLTYRQAAELLAAIRDGRVERELAEIGFEASAADVTRSIRDQLEEWIDGV